MMQDLFVLLTGIILGYGLWWVRENFNPRAPVVPAMPERNLGCSKLIHHACRCVLPHGHVVRIHRCDHGSAWAETREAQEDMVSEN